MSETPKTVEFTPEAVKAYLDSVIVAWRGIRDGPGYDKDRRSMAVFYIDAYQSVRASLFDELLAP